MKEQKRKVEYNDIKLPFKSLYEYVINQIIIYILDQELRRGNKRRT